MVLIWPRRRPCDKPQESPNTPPKVRLWEVPHDPKRHEIREY
jgi:hypothetical protein